MAKYWQTNFSISLKQKKISYMKKVKNRQERRYQSYRYRRKSNRIYQSQSEWNIERCIKPQIMRIQLIFENLTGKFWLNIRLEVAHEKRTKTRCA